MPDNLPATSVLGALLAGGRSARMGEQDKSLLRYQDETLLERALKRARPQVNDLVVCSNNPQHQRLLPEVTVLADTLPGYPGPTAGIISAFQHAQNKGQTFRWLATFASDTPFFPLNLVSELLNKGLEQAPDSQVIIPRCEGRDHFVFALWAWTALPLIEAQVQAGERALKRIIQTLPSSSVPFPEDRQSFFNVNTPEQWAQLQQLAI